jgi:hypothetical protein
LIEFAGGVSEAVIISDVVEKFLRVQSASKKESKVSISRLDDTADNIHRVCARESVLVRKAVLLFLAQRDLLSKCISNP